MRAMFRLSSKGCAYLQQMEGRIHPWALLPVLPLATDGQEGLLGFAETPMDPLGFSGEKRLKGPPS
jgi:hypothetical protein